MSQSLTNLLYHIVFSTKNREKLIIPEIKEELYNYIGGTIKGEEGHLLSIGGMDDHIHILAVLSKNKTISYMLQHIKAGSTKWMHEVKSLDYFAWQRGYGAFTVSESNLSKVKNYLESQEEHHKKMTFKEEFLILLKKHNIKFDEKYLWN